MIFPLRHRGAKLSPLSPFYLSGKPGVLIFESEPYERYMHARLLDLETRQEVLRLERARVVKIRDGGVLVSGDQMFYRGTKSKGEVWRQTWWCVPITSVGWRDVKTLIQQRFKDPLVAEAQLEGDETTLPSSDCPTQE